VSDFQEEQYSENSNCISVIVLLMPQIKSSALFHFRIKSEELKSEMADESPSAGDRPTIRHGLRLHRIASNP
jgi:hypothetical protein